MGKKLHISIAAIAILGLSACTTPNLYRTKPIIVQSSISKKEIAKYKKIKMYKAMAYAGTDVNNQLFISMGSSKKTTEGQLASRVLRVCKKINYTSGTCKIVAIGNKFFAKIIYIK